MTKPALFAYILWPSYSDIIFYIDHYSAGGYQISIAYCLFFICSRATLSCDSSYCITWAESLMIGILVTRL